MRRNEDERGEEEEMGMRVEREGKKEGGGGGRVKELTIFLSRQQKNPSS